MSKLFANTVFVSQISECDKKVMFELFQNYYENNNFEKFCSDLSKKERVIIIRDNQRKIIRGFSTLQKIELNQFGKKIIGLFSGDTVIDSNYWGGTALSVEFFKNVVFEKIKNPTSEVYWFLISKGYKTYLLLANNFKNYYPRYDQPTPVTIKNVIKSFANHIYDEDLYDEQTMILKCAFKFDRLKSNVAPISKEMALLNPKIDFFQKSNPNWNNGDELCCVGKIDLGFATHFLSRTWKKQMKKMKLIPSNA